MGFLWSEKVFSCFFFFIFGHSNGLLGSPQCGSELSVQLKHGRRVVGSRIVASPRRPKRGVELLTETEISGKVNF